MRLDTQKSFTELYNYKYLYIYKCSYLYILIQDYKSGDKFKLGAFIKKQTFNLQNLLEKQLARIYGFYYVLSRIYKEKEKMLINSSSFDDKENIDIAFKLLKETKSTLSLLEWNGDGMDQNSYSIWFDYENKNIIKYSYDDFFDQENKIKGELTINEFNLLMQIYFGVYNDETLKNRLEEKEKKGELEKNSEEYLKLKLMRKDISGAFEGIEIEKIYDKDWSEEKQRKYIDEINKEFGEEVVVEE